MSSAWELVKGKVANYSMCIHVFLLVYIIIAVACVCICTCIVPASLAQMQVPQDCFDVTMSEELKLEWLIPTFTGRGVVTLAMLDMLVRAHNDFIEMSQAVVTKGQKETK